MLKKASLVLLASLLLPYANIPTAGAETPVSNEVVLTLNDTAALSKGTHVQLSSAPYLLNDTTMVPLRFVGEALGADIQWDAATRSITLTYGTQSLQLAVDSNEATQDGKAVQLDQPAVIVNESTMVPLRFIAEYFNYTVSFDPADKTITLVSRQAQPVQTETKTEEGKPKRLAKITVDNLTIDPEFNAPRLYQTIIPSIAADKSGRIYMIEKDNTIGYVIKEYDPAKGNTLRIVSKIDGSYNFEYIDISEYDSMSDPTPVRKGAFYYINLFPSELKYSYATDTLYIIGGKAVYQLFPEVKMVTHWYTFTYSGIPFRERRTIETKFNNPGFFDTADGETFYSGTPFSIYATQKGGGSRYVANSSKKDTRLISTVKDGVIYAYDQLTGEISTVTDQGYTTVARAQIDNVVNMTSANGRFYVMDANKIYRIDTDGHVETHVAFDELYYNRGLYNPKTGRYDQIFFQSQYRELRVNKDAPEQVNELREKAQVEPGPVKIHKDTLLTVDGKENIIFFDEHNRMLRRIHIYE
ncbi:Copper amine oxidase N-terminal domain-containing protein [Paenibacillus sp. UNCCL117]|uniref:copper amine oxidase N-terminal domain-containing protein n=1 Tax=unclassified Paenibacillus TaxID=185978 RepID=UPI0008810EC6|nr:MULTISPECIES: stalk domain-containing protein [unclassified Paenibacillus]SDD64068.1 Copper amine oxidase N-terminal domain-containing protein [Paenibacillus sp. cl123]SFW58397.1 Copper amine oxidase N-terminal domain-containing protein [Paenibacillus sp. UNCCL117]